MNRIIRVAGKEKKQWQSRQESVRIWLKFFTGTVTITSKYCVRLNLWMLVLPK